MTSPVLASEQPSQPVPGTIEGDPAWCRAVLVFNLSPITYAHPSWLPLDLPNAPRAVRRELSSELLAQQSLSDSFHWDPTQAVLRPMLLSVASWNDLALAAGVIAHRNRLRQVVQREVLAQWHTLLGDRLDLLWAPLAERLPALPAGGRAAPGPQALEALREDGTALLLGLLDENDPAHAPVLRRARMRLPRERCVDPVAWQPQLAQADVVAQNLMDLLSRWSPQWTWLS